MKIWDWFSKEENIGKIDSIFKFLKDWWPALLAAYLVFGNGLTRFALGLIAKLGIWTAKLMGPVIKGLLAAATKMGPWGWKAAAVIGTGLAVYGVGKMMGKDKEVENISEGVTTGVEQGDANQVDVQRALPEGVDTGVGSGQSPIDTIRNEAINPLGPNVPNLKFNQGGQVPGSGNRDTVPAMLTPGEFVMSKGAVSKWGANTLAGMNAAGGGTNQPNVMMSGGGPVSIKPRGISYYSQGGSVSLPSMNFHSPIKNNFQSPIQHFQGGGGVKRIQAAQQLQKEINVGPMATKNPKVVVVDAAGGESADASQAQLPPAGNREIPSFDATAFRSTRKMEVLGISP